MTLVSEVGGLEATFAPRVGMVGCSLRHAGEELLEAGGGLGRYAAGGGTMGIPLLHPWANRLSELSFGVGRRRVTLARGPCAFRPGGRRPTLTVELLEGYPVAVVWRPPDGDFICFEPMTARTNALVTGGPDLRLVEPGGSYTAVFAIGVEHTR